MMATQYRLNRISGQRPVDCARAVRPGTASFESAVKDGSPDFDGECECPWPS